MTKENYDKTVAVFNANYRGSRELLAVMEKRMHNESALPLILTTPTGQLLSFSSLFLLGAEFFFSKKNFVVVQANIDELERQNDELEEIAARDKDQEKNQETD